MLLVLLQQFQLRAKSEELKAASEPEIKGEELSAGNDRAEYFSYLPEFVNVGYSHETITSGQDSTNISSFYFKLKKNVDGPLSFDLISSSAFGPDSVELIKVETQIGLSYLIFESLKKNEGNAEGNSEGNFEYKESLEGDIARVRKVFIGVGASSLNYYTDYESSSHMGYYGSISYLEPFGDYLSLEAEISSKIFSSEISFNMLSVSLGVSVDLEYLINN